VRSGNTSLAGRIFDTSSKDAVHQFPETVKAIADYVGQEYTHGGDIRFMIENLEDYNFTRPVNPVDEEDQFEIESWKKQLDQYWKRRGIYADNKMKLYSLIWGQSTKATQSKIETHKEFKQCKTDYDSLKLLKIIREFVFRSDDHQYKYKAEDQAKRAYYNLRQTPEMSCQESFEWIRNIVDVIKSLGGSLCDDMHLKEELPDRNRPRGEYTEQQRTEVRERIQNKTITYGILVRTDRTRYGKLIEEVENDFLKGHDDYPKTPTEAYNLLVNYRNYVTVNKRTTPSGGLDQVAFVTEGKRQRTEGGENKYPHIKCFKCGKFGHYKSDCPGKSQGQSQGADERTQEPTQIAFITQHVTLAVTRMTIDPMWILCDNESTVDIFQNKDMLSNIWRTTTPILLKGIDGNSIDVEEEGQLSGYGTVYYHPSVAADVLSFFNLTKQFKSVTYNNQEQDAFLVRRDEDSILEFAPFKEGLYYYDYRNSISRSMQPPVHSTMVVESVEELRRNLTKKELKQAETARRLYVMMGRPSINDFASMIKKGKILNNPVSMDDYKTAETIYGKDLGVIKGKTVRMKPNPVMIDIEMTVRQKYNIILAVDIMQFTGMNFLVTVSRNIRFITVMYLSNRKKKTIVHAVKQAIAVYRGKGHTVTDIEFTETGERPIHTILADSEFEAIREEMEECGIRVNVTAQ